jgi:hypothetical protein
VATKPTISTAAVGARISAAAWNAQVYNLGNFVQNKRPVVSLNQATPQACSSGTYTTITFDAEQLDTDAQHSTASLTSRVVIGNTLGWYRVYGAVPFSATAAGQRIIAAIAFNGGRVNGETSIIVGGSSITTACTMAIVQSTVSTDYVELMGWQNVGAINTTVNTTTRPILIVEYLGDFL